MSKTKSLRFLTPALTAGVLLTGLCALPTTAHAQEPPAEAKSDTKSPVNKLADKKVTLRVEETSLSVALKLLMKSAGADFSVDPALKDARVTVNLTNVRLQVALDTLMKVSSLPATYRVSDTGIYLFEPRPDPPPVENPPPSDNSTKPAPPQARYEYIRLKNADPSYIAWLLGGQPFQVLGQNYGAFSGDFSGSKTFSNGPFGGSGSAQFGTGNGNTNRQNNTSDWRTLGNFFNMLLGGGGGSRRR
jgi:hypothetical protein